MGVTESTEFQSVPSFSQDESPSGRQEWNNLGPPSRDRPHTLVVLHRLHTPGPKIDDGSDPPRPPTPPSLERPRRERTRPSS